MEDKEETVSCWKKIKQCLWNNRLTYLMVLSVILGIVIAIIVRRFAEPPSKQQERYLVFVGDILIRLLKCTSLPLIIACIIAAVSTLDLSVSRTIGWQFALLLVLTKVLSTAVGLATVVLIHPGSSGGSTAARSLDNQDEQRRCHLVDVFLDMLRNMIPTNMMEMYVHVYETVLKPPTRNLSSLEEGPDTDQADLWTWDVAGRQSYTMNLLGMIFMAIIIGASLNLLQEREKGLIALTTEVYNVAMKVAHWVVWAAPFFLFFLVFSEIVRIEDFGTYMSTWGIFLLTLHAGFLVIAVIQYPLLLFIMAGVNPLRFYVVIMKAVVAGYVTSSSMATMPMCIDCLLKEGIDERIVRFVVPIGVNVNKDGAACRLAIAVVFISQMVGCELTWVYYVTIAILSLMGSVIAPAVPFTTIAVLVMLLSSLGFPQGCGSRSMKNRDELYVHLRRATEL
ncbi:hypothetical protein R5R35_009979 [Gryllus longicercus]|uniref:Amino acid transporter n=1 Tax=Gryllus longicercus TaxID=2509291 RepID=A0AAN9V4Q1_9ORTH